MKTFRSLSMLILLSLVLGSSAFSQVMKQCADGSVVMPPITNGCPEDEDRGACPAACWCPGGGGPGCFSTSSVSLLPATMRPATPQQIAALQIAVANVYLRKRELVLVAEVRPLLRR